jgi:ABC-type uncharacterized transport system ATPase subunit
LLRVHHDAIRRDRAELLHVFSVEESSLSAEEVSTWPGVVDAKREGAKLRITTTDAESVVRRLLAGDANLARLEVKQAGLNEAFNELTREAA